MWVLQIHRLGSKLLPRDQVSILLARGNYQLWKIALTINSDDIIECQTTYKKKILLSIGGDSDKYGGWATVAEAQAFGDRVWDMFGKGWSYYRPFGKAIVDGFDLDLERGPSTGYEHFAFRLRKLMDADKKATGKQWFLTAAPQCPLPDAIMDVALTKVSFDALFVQFYNNPNCAASQWVKAKDQSTNSGFNFGMWDTWAKTKSLNKNVKIFLTLPMHTSAAGSGYVSKDQAVKIVQDLAPRFSSFAGVAAWDASYAWANSAYLPAVKKALNTLQGVTPVKRDLRFHAHHHMRPASL